MLIGPTSTPAAVELEAAKLHLRVDNQEEEFLIMSLIVAATQMAEHELGRALVAQEWTLKLDKFPSGCIHLAMSPVQSIVSIRYVDAYGVAQELTEYELVDSPSTPLLNGAWPEGSDVVITFKAGFGEIEDVPKSIQQWILAHVGNMYANRESTIDKQILVTPFIARLLDRYRIWRV